MPSFDEDNVCFEYFMAASTSTCASFRSVPFRSTTIVDDLSSQARPHMAGAVLCELNVAKTETHMMRAADDQLTEWKLCSRAEKNWIKLRHYIFIFFYISKENYLNHKMVKAEQIELKRRSGAIKKKNEIIRWVFKCILCKIGFSFLWLTRDSVLWVIRASLGLTHGVAHTKSFHLLVGISIWN